ncbi:hypothetical protein DS742_05135 [Lacrimispora amygdalina]|uniref:Uncharacterized protein n=1 Tax=Lacrimispora amygdalina TaxID=253257 RepID=A0A3E2NFS4_9FIRM|nr:hypothetical protein [Clostridium indicum]RFZ79846.1 hypothetical protein DS742_05135 [Clostridium indicum]
MKIYVNEQYEIISLDKEIDGYKHVFNTDQTRSDLFGNLCDTCVRGYKYEPLYEMLFNEDGSNQRDENTGEILCKVDEHGNKITHGFSCHPFVPYQTLMLIQKQYEDSQKQINDLNAQVAYLQMMSIKEEV